MLRRLLCNHQWQVVERGDLLRAGSSLTAGAKVGEWIKSRCTKCDCTRTRKHID